ncbi:phage antirepressor KilAC domain-containing protein [Comamonas aquatilis]
MNRQQTEFHLPRELTDTLLTGYSAALRLAVVRRWHELEAQQAPKLPQTMAQALRLAAEQAEQIEAQQEQLALAAPKVEYVDRYVAANGSMGFRQVAKLLQANEHEFRAWMQDEKVMYRLGNEWTAYQNHIEAGRFVVRAGVASANDHAFNTTKFTPKGVEWVAGLWGKHKAALALDSGVQA